MKVIHQRYVAYSDAHYAGNLVDGHESLFAGYSSVEFLAPVRGGDVIEVEARLVSRGKRSRAVAFELRVICRSLDETGRAEVLAEPIVATRALGTGVVPADAVKKAS
ncbi:hotdog domain-containing protein [Streptomyces sp. NPDC057743]|uniref:hotdog domain-containing protein n=1 Tax=Streptomyces sp. NPDC057743 TaxID=3346236 RepID=UPI00368EC8E9